MMNCHEILLALTANNQEEAESFDDKLQQILQKTIPTFSTDDTKFITGGIENVYEPFSTRYQYLRALILVLQNMQISNNTDDNALVSVSEFRIIKVAIELIISIGIIPCLLPGVGIEIAKLCPRASQLSHEKLTDMQKYERLQFSVCSLIKLYDDTLFRPAILSHLGPLLASLLQLSHAPLMKPFDKCKSREQGNTKQDEFKMTTDLYNKLKKDQEEFALILQKLLNNCPESTSIKELMVILGAKEAPNWLRKQTRKYLIERIMRPDGVVSIIAAVCDDTLDLGEHWNKLDTISRLIATPHGSNSYEYYQAICPQLLHLLATTQIKHSSTIANCFISALYNCNPDVCLKNIVEVISAPLLLKPDNKHEKGAVKDENEVEQCLENLTKCFITAEAKFKHLPCKVISETAVPLFCVHNDIRQSACALKSKVEQLVLRLLYEESFRKSLFAAFLGHEITGSFGYHTISRFGPTGGIEIIGIEHSPRYEEYADNLFELVSTNEVLAFNLFSYLLNFLSNSTKLDDENTQNLLETDDDAMERIDKQLAALKLLSNLANTSSVQEAQIKNPEPLFSFIKSLFIEYNKKNQSPTEEDNYEVLYVSVMLVKLILNERKKALDWRPFNDFAKFLKEHCDLPNMPAQLSLLTREVIDLIEKQGRFGRQHYQDLSVDRKTTNKLEEAMKDLTDPLIPVRAHGLITLTKLIETLDSSVTARKGIVLQLFQENLKHEDSFIYLAAINGLCALATTYPQVVIETLVQEFIDMPQRISSTDLSPETRVKLGEILVKTTRALGEMAAIYKNTLVNGFLCATRDSDSLVRASSLSCLGELCKVLGFRLGNIVSEVIYCISCIIKSDKAPECRRAAVMVCTLLLRGLGRDTLTSLGKDLVDLFRGLKYLRDNDDDPVLRLHAQLALEEFDHVVQDFLFSPPKLEKRIFLLDPPSQ